MATIHEFRAVDRGATSPKPVSAEIIIFPGIRYEYWEAPKTQKAASKRETNRTRRRSRRVKRDYLEIPA